MDALLRYLDICNGGDGVVVARISPIEGGIRLERSWRYRQRLDLTHGYAEQDAVSHNSSEGNGAILGTVQDMPIDDRLMAHER